MKNQTKGIIFILLSSFFFAVMAAIVKSLPHIPIPQKIFFRNIVGAMVLGVTMIKNKTNFIDSNMKLLTLRALFGLLGVATYFYAIAKLPLSDAALLNRMSPFFVILLSYIFLKEKIHRLQIYALVIALIGAIFVIKPQFSYTVIPALIGLSSALFAAGGYTTVRQLRLYAAPETVVFYFSMLSTIFTIPFMLMGYWVHPTPRDFIILLSIGVFALIAQIFMTIGYRFAPASELAIYDYANVIFSTLMGIILWYEYPDLLSVTGGLLIILGGFINYIANKNNEE